MRNPLIKRLPRELKHDAGKYIVISLFLIATIGFISGFLVADGSMKRAYDESFVKYNIEDGHFELSAPADDSLLTKLQDKNITISENYYIDASMQQDHTIRIYANRETINLPSILSGRLPSSDSEIALDRLYAENNKIETGNTIVLDGKNFTVCGFIALSDYSALFKNNTDMMFDAQKFSVALVTQNAFHTFGETGLHYCYAWTDKQQQTEQDKNKAADEILKTLAANASVTDFVKRSDNQAICFTGNDMGSDKAMITWMLYIVIAVLAFIFAVTTNNTIEQESAVIGTLRASGYTKGEMLRHYLSLPIIVYAVSAVIGNILGYTVMKQIVAGMYYHSYSLPAYYTVWNAEAFLLTTVIPLAIMLIVNLIVLIKKLALPPLKFLRRDLRKNKKSRVPRLPEVHFLSRFRLRVILQNIPAYATLLIGIILANTLLFFGMLMPPLLDHFKIDVVQRKISDYQYILKAPASTGNTDAEKYSAMALYTLDTGEEITVYGIQEDSKYLPSLSLHGSETALSDGYMEKYGLSAGDKITLKEKYSDITYTFRVSKQYSYPAALSIFMSSSCFNETFGKDNTYFTGYFSNEKLTDIDENLIASTITEHDLTIIAHQLEDSVGKILPMFGGFSVLLYMLMIYLLSKLVLEKNAASISMVKILGYNNREIGKLYIIPTAVVVLLSLLVSLPLSYYIIKLIYYIMMKTFNGWLTFYVDPLNFVWMMLIGISAYALISLQHLRKIKSIPMEEALKNAE